VVLIPYLEPEFLDPDSCRHIRRAMDAGTPDDAEVLDAAIEARAAVRRASSIEIDEDCVRAVESRFDARRAAIAAYFDVVLTGREGAGFIRYPAGGFYAPHRDCADVPSWPDAARRRIALVVFLNDATGTLRLCIDTAPVDVTPREGLLVAFPADTLHEVTVVQAGVRDAIVDWFYG
jgi:predicted 2-oxoglutarate/Fe(II)-dependent dioxygenase YbiX